MSGGADTSLAPRGAREAMDCCSLAGRASGGLSPALLREIAKAIRTIRYGSVQIIIHDARVVQIEKAEKIRLPQDASPACAAHAARGSEADLTPGGA